MGLMRITAAFAAGLLAWQALPAAAQDAWPSRPITYVAAFAPGSNTDTLGRLIARKLSESLKVPVVVENKAGGTGTIGSSHVARAAPDGYTILGASIASHAIAPSIQRSVPYDPVKSFEPVTVIGMNANVLVVPLDSPFKSVADIVAAAKSSPGTLSFASSGVGTTQHLSGELLQKLAGIRLVHVPYARNPGLVDVMAGQVPMMFEGPVAFPHVHGGKLRALAVTSPKRLAALPDVPTMIEAGVPGYEVQAWQAVFAPAGTPKPIVARLHAEIARALKAPDVAEQLDKMGVEASGMSPEAFAAFQKAEIDKWRQLIDSAGIKSE